MNFFHENFINITPPSIDRPPVHVSPASPASILGKTLANPQNLPHKPSNALVDVGRTLLMANKSVVY